MKEKRIGNLGAFFLIVTALLVDAAQFLLTLTLIGTAVSWVFAPFVWLSFFIWLMVGWNVSYTGKGGATKALSAITSFIVELVPAINAIPATTAGILAIIAQNRITVAAEAKKEAQKHKADRARQQANVRRTRELVRQRRMQAANDNFEEEERREAA